MIRTALAASTLVTATLIAISSSAIGSANSGTDTAGEDIRTTQIADAYARGGETYSILAGMTVKEKTSAGCETDVTHIVTVPRAEKNAPAKKGDRLATFGCTVIALN